MYIVHITHIYAWQQRTTSYLEEARTGRYFHTDFGKYVYKAAYYSLYTYVRERATGGELILVQSKHAGSEFGTRRINYAVQCSRSYCTMHACFPPLFFSFPFRPSVQPTPVYSCYARGGKQQVQCSSAPAAWCSTYVVVARTRALASFHIERSWPSIPPRDPRSCTLPSPLVLYICILFRTLARQPACIHHQACATIWSSSTAPPIINPAACPPPFSAPLSQHN